MRSYLLIVLLLLSPNIFAFEAGYFNEHAKGWHWYNSQTPEVADESEDPHDPVLAMNAVRAAVNRAKDKMVLDPTKENVKSYIAIQNKISGNAAELSRTWQEVLTENPGLDFSLVHPTNNVAKQVENDIHSQKENEAIHQLAKTSGLFFFYRSSCPYCVKFAPIVKDFSDSYGIHVIPITTDGISLPEFPNSYPDQGHSAKFKVKVEPALFIVNPVTHKAIPVAYGLTSQAELKQKILSIAESKKEINQ